MRKTTIALGISILLAAQPALAELSLSGMVSPSINFDSPDSWTGAGRIGSITTIPPTGAGVPGTPHGNKDGTFMEDNNSSIGLKFEEDLGNGNRVIGFVDFSYDPTEPGAGGEIDSRDQYVGLAGNWGRLVFGSTSTSYKSSGKAIDPMWSTAVQARGAFNQMSALHSGSGGLRGRQDNMVRYDSPAVYGLTAIGWLSLEEEVTNDHAWGAGLHYDNGPLFASIDYLTDDSTGQNDEAYKFAARYSLGNFSVWGHYEVDGGLVSAAEFNEDFGPGTMQILQAGAMGSVNANLALTCTVCRITAKGGDVLYLGGSARLGNNFVQLAWGRRDGADAALNETPITSLDTGSETWSVVAGHHFSRRTMAYIGYAGIEYHKDASELLVQSGTLSTTALTLAEIIGTAKMEGATDSVDHEIFTIGIQHRF